MKCWEEFCGTLLPFYSTGNHRTSETFDDNDDDGDDDDDDQEFYVATPKRRRMIIKRRAPNFQSDNDTTHPAASLQKCAQPPICEEK